MNNDANKKYMKITGVTFKKLILFTMSHDPSRRRYITFNTENVYKLIILLCFGVPFTKQLSCVRV